MIDPSLFLSGVPNGVDPAKLRAGDWNGLVAAVEYLYATVGLPPATNGTNDNTALQAWLDALAGRTARMPDGEWLISHLDIPADTTLELSARTILKQRPGVSQTIITGHAGSVLRGGEVDGNRANCTGGAFAPLISLEGDWAKVKGTYVHAATGQGILSGTFNHIEIDDNRVEDTGYTAISGYATAATTHMSVCRNKVDRSNEDPTTVLEGGIKIHGSSGTDWRHIRVQDNDVSMPVNPTDGAAICIEVWYAPSSVTTGNITSGGAMGVSSAANPYSVTGANTAYNAKDIGIEKSGDYRSVVFGSTVDGNGRTLVGIGSFLGDGLPSSGLVIAGVVVADVQDRGVELFTGEDYYVGASFLHANAGALVIDLSTVVGFKIDAIIQGDGNAHKGVMADSSVQGVISGVIRGLVQDSINLRSAISGFDINNILVSGAYVAGAPNALILSPSGGATVGHFIKVQGSLGFGLIGNDDYWDAGADVRDAAWWTGDPEGSIAAGQGSTMRRTNGGLGASTFEVKQTGAGNTGWVP